MHSEKKCPSTVEQKHQHIDRLDASIEIQGILNSTEYRKHMLYSSSLLEFPHVSVKALNVVISTCSPSNFSTLHCLLDTSLRSDQSSCFVCFTLFEAPAVYTVKHCF